MDKKKKTQRQLIHFATLQTNSPKIHVKKMKLNKHKKTNLKMQHDIK